MVDTLLVAAFVFLPRLIHPSMIHLMSSLFCKSILFFSIPKTCARTHPTRVILVRRVDTIPLRRSRSSLREIPRSHHLLSAGLSPSASSCMRPLGVQSPRFEQTPSTSVGCIHNQGESRACSRPSVVALRYYLLHLARHVPLPWHVVKPPSTPPHWAPRRAQDSAIGQSPDAAPRPQWRCAGRVCWARCLGCAA